MKSLQVAVLVLVANLCVIETQILKFPPKEIFDIDYNQLDLCFQSQERNTWSPSRCVDLWYFDSKFNDCLMVQATDRGCELKGIKYFEKKSDCMTECQLPIQIIKEACKQRRSSGPCRAFVPRYFYNSKTGSCFDFVYGGCGGNLNSFSSIEECLRYCKPSNHIVTF